MDQTVWLVYGRTHGLCHTGFGAAGGSVPEIVRDGVSGYVCRSVSQLARRVSNLQTNPMNPRDLRQYVQENFSLERMVAGYAALYEEAQAGRRAKKIA